MNLQALGPMLDSQFMLITLKSCITLEPNEAFHHKPQRFYIFNFIKEEHLQLLLGQRWTQNNLCRQQEAAGNLVSDECRRYD